MSAGYEIAAGCHQIVAQKTSLVGSVGVCFARKLSTNRDSFMRYALKESYYEFIHNLAVCRANNMQMTIEQAKKVFLSTEARIFTAERAKEIKLIDHIGNMHFALSLLRSQIHQPCVVFHYEEEEERIIRSSWYTSLLKLVVFRRKIISILKFCASVPLF